MRALRGPKEYRYEVTRTPLQLAALASSAVPGLDPELVQAATAAPDHYYEVAFVTDSQQRMWVVRAPVTSAAGAQMDTTVALLGLIGRRLPFAVPAPRGFVGVPEGRAVVYPHISGRPINLATLPPGPGLAAELGRTLAAIHNLDRGLFDEAALPVYDSETYRTRRLADLDRAAATGHVPSALLSRWERALEDVSMWRFAPTPVHGDLNGDQVLVVFEDPDDVATGRVRGITGWDDAQVADPAVDFAAVVIQCDEATVETVLEAYANSRVERPDPHLRRRARLAAELRLLTALLTAVSAGRRDLIRAYAADLRDLDERTIDEPDESVESDLTRGEGSRGPRPAQESAFDREQLDEDEFAGDESDDEAPADEAPDEKPEGDGPEDDGPEDDGPDVDGPVDDRPDVGDNTQPISGVRLGAPTTVIPKEELDRIREDTVAHHATSDAEAAKRDDDGPDPTEPEPSEPEPPEPPEPDEPPTGPVTKKPSSGTGIESDTWR